MPTAERREPARPAAAPAAAQAVGSRPQLRRGWAWTGLAAVLAGGLGLRLWGVKYGLPYVYNIDEAGHFVPKAVAMFGHGLNPRYFVNPPGLTYVLHIVFAVWFGGGQGTLRRYAGDPGDVFLVARVTVALLGAGAVWLLYLTGARLFDRGVGLLAAAIEAVAFLPVFYAHFALNDAATLLPLTLSLLGCALVLRRGRLGDYLLAGVGLGLACAGKYTAGIAIVPLAAAAAVRYIDAPRGQAGRVAGGLALAAAAALGAFLIANPYAALDFTHFHADLVHQSSLSEEAQGKLGAPKDGGVVYYLWSLTWGLGWAPALAALGGAVLVWRRDARVGWVLVPAPLLFLAFMGLEGRYFGRWLLPVFPMLCLLGGFLGLALARSAAALLGRASLRRAPAQGGGRYGRAIGAVAGLLMAGLLLWQGVLYSVHSDVVLARADTRALTRSWMVLHVPRGARIVLEPVVLNDWLDENGPGPRTTHPPRWQKYPALRSLIDSRGNLLPSGTRTVKVEDYELTLAPSLVQWYARNGYCWVLTGSTQSGRAYADPRNAPLALAYYRELARRANVAYSVSPYSPGSSPVGFSFDWSFDYYPLAFERPGPRMTVYRLHGGRCSAAQRS